MPACLGLDYGLRRIGAAANDAHSNLAFAVGTHVEGRDGSVFLWLEKFITERNLEVIVVGWPLKSSGEVGDLAERAAAFAEKLRQKFGLKTLLWDERYSSQEADRWLRQARRREPGDRDALAAEIILQSYLDSLAAADERDPA